MNKWSHRFELEGLDGLADRKGRGRKATIEPEKINRVISEATRPPAPRNRWSVRKMAREVGISPDSVHRIWKANEIKPHLTHQFKISNDPQFERKFWDVIGLYLDPPERALVLCCDEKSQVQALERTQPGLPLGIGHVRTRTHDYRRHGTISLFAALNYLDGKIISRTEEHHTHVEWLRFLKQIERETPKELELHLIADNYSTHNHKTVKAWLSRHRRFHMHFTPTSSSWMNLVERFFSELTTEVVREGSFLSVRRLVRDIEDYLTQRNLDPKPYRWKADGEEMLPMAGGRVTLGSRSGPCPAPRFRLIRGRTGEDAAASARVERVRASPAIATTCILVSSVRFTPVGHTQDQHGQLILAQLVDDSVLALTGTPEAREVALQAGTGRRVLREPIDSRNDPAPCLGVQLADGSQRATLDPDRVDQI